MAGQTKTGFIVAWICIKASYKLQKLLTGYSRTSVKFQKYRWELGNLPQMTHPGSAPGVCSQTITQIIASVCSLEYFIAIKSASKFNLITSNFENSRGGMLPNSLARACYICMLITPHTLRFPIDTLFTRLVGSFQIFLFFSILVQLQVPLNVDWICPWTFKRCA